MGQFILRNKALADFLKSEEAREVCEPIAEATLARAKADAPVRTGAYRNSLKIVNDTTDRAVVRVGSSLPYAGLVEALTGNLARALNGGGGRYKYTSKSGNVSYRTQAEIDNYRRKR